MWKHWLFDTTVTWLFQWSIKHYGLLVSVDHSTLTLLQPQPTIQVRVKHCTLALRSARHALQHQPSEVRELSGAIWDHLFRAKPPCKPAGFSWMHLDAQLFPWGPHTAGKNQCTSNSDAYRFMLSACARKMQTQSYKLLSPKCPQGYECDLRLHSPLQILLATMVSVREVALRTAASCSHCVFLFYVKDHKVQIGPRTHSVQLICTT